MANFADFVYFVKTQFSIYSPFVIRAKKESGIIEFISQSPFYHLTVHKIGVFHQPCTSHSVLENSNITVQHRQSQGARLFSLGGDITVTV